MDACMHTRIQTNLCAPNTRQRRIGIHVHPNTTYCIHHTAHIHMRNAHTHHTWKCTSAQTPGRYSRQPVNQRLTPSEKTKAPPQIVRRRIRMFQTERGGEREQSKALEHRKRFLFFSCLKKDKFIFEKTEYTIQCRRGNIRRPTPPA